MSSGGNETRARQVQYKKSYGYPVPSTNFGLYRSSVFLQDLVYVDISFLTTLERVWFPTLLWQYSHSGTEIVKDTSSQQEKSILKHLEVCL